MRETHVSRLYPVLITLTVLLINACGGGGSSDSSSDSSSDMPKEVPTFSVGGTLSAISSGELVLQNNNIDDLTVSGITFEFPTRLNDNSNYDVTILTQPIGSRCDVTNGRGTIKGENINDVSLICNNWSLASVLDDNTGKAFYPEIAFDPAGSAVVIWHQDFGSVGRIWSNHHIPGGGWGTAEAIDSNTDSSAARPELAIDNSGNVLVVWEEYNRGTRSFEIWSNRYTAGGGWGTAEVVATSIYHALLPQIATDSAGNAIVVYEMQASSGDPVNYIYANRYTAGGNWGAAERINFNAGIGNSFPQVAFDDTGNAMAVWHQTDGARLSIYSNRYTAGAGWGTAELLESSDNGDHVNPQIATDDNGNALAVWVQDDGIFTHIWANRYTVGIGWGTAELIDPDDDSPSRYGGFFLIDNPQIAFDSTGNAIAVWYEFDGNKQNIWSNRYTTGSGWGSAEIISTEDTGHYPNQQIAIDSTGNAVVVWSQYDGTHRHIWSNRYTMGSGWGTAGIIQINGTVSSYDPQIAIDTAGNIQITWWSSQGNILGSRLE